MRLIPLLLAGLLPSQEPAKSSLAAKVQVGMTAGQVKQLLGRPDQVSRQIVFRRHVEQWRYEQFPGWLEFQCPRGEEARVSHVHENDKRR